MTVEEGIATKSRRPQAIFPGRPSKFAFAGLLLPSIEWEMKIEELPMRVLEDDPVIGTFYRNQRREDAPAFNPGMLAKMREALQSSRFGSRSADIAAALDGDVQRMKWLESLGIWGAYTLGREGLTPTESHYAFLEPFCAEADGAFRRGSYAQAAQIVSSTSELSLYWRHGSLDQLARARTEAETAPSRLVAWLELQIAAITKFAVCDCRGATYQDMSDQFARLLEGSPDAPGAQWVRVLQRMSGSKSLAYLLTMASDCVGVERLPSDATFKRWCSGRSFPSEMQARALIEGVVTSVRTKGRSELEQVAAEKSLIAHFWVARRLDAALRFASLLGGASGSERLMCENLGSATPQTWLRESYEHWMTHWRTCSASESRRSSTVP